MLDGGGVLAVGPEHDDAGMTARWVVAQITDAAVEGEHHSVFRRGGADYNWIATSGEVFVDDSVDVVAASGECSGQVVWQVLVELELHAGSGRISSRASAAP